MAAMALVSTATFAEESSQVSKTTQKVMTAEPSPKSLENILPSMRTPVIDFRLERLRRAIVRGVENGKLTTGEAHSLSTKWERVKRDQEKAEHNKSITPMERRLLRKKITDLADDVYKQTRDESVREPAQ
jgi:hypothetical protein